MSRKTLNLGILAHVDAGKTTLTERLLYAVHHEEVAQVVERHPAAVVADDYPSLLRVDDNVDAWGGAGVDVLAEGRRPLPIGSRGAARRRSS